MKKKIVIALVFGLVIVLVFVLPSALRNGRLSPPGEGAEAVAGKKYLQFLIDVVETAKAKNGVYPETLGQLLPLFSENTQQGFLDLETVYRPDNTRGVFEVKFWCEDEGQRIRCVWQSEKRSWTCRFADEPY